MYIYVFPHNLPNAVDGNILSMIDRTLILYCCVSRTGNTCSFNIFDKRVFLAFCRLKVERRPVNRPFCQPMSAHTWLKRRSISLTVEVRLKTVRFRITDANCRLRRLGIWSELLLVQNIHTKMSLRLFTIIGPPSRGVENGFRSGSEYFGPWLSGIHNYAMSTECFLKAMT